MAHQILWLDDPMCRDATITGGKVASLGQLTADFNVPEGFAVSMHAFDQWSPEVLGRSSKVAIPIDFLNQITDAYHALGTRTNQSEPIVAVRSSAAGEDGLTTSFAGQFSTYLGVVGVNAVIRSIIGCWGSLLAGPIRNYQDQHNKGKYPMKMGTLVQVLIPADVSGVAFSAHPVTGDRTTAIVNSSLGLGESVLSGAIPTDTFNVDRQLGTIISCDVVNKKHKIVASGGQTIRREVSPSLAYQPSLTDLQVSELNLSLSRLEEKFGFPVDIEFAFLDGVLFLLQCRPITSLPKERSC